MGLYIQGSGQGGWIYCQICDGQIDIGAFNFDDKEYYKYMYERINNGYKDLRYEHMQLQWKHKLSIDGIIFDGWL